jgi:hypothetical protein
MALPTSRAAKVEKMCAWRKRGSSLRTSMTEEGADFMGFLGGSEGI